MGKHCGILRTFVNYVRKKCYNNGPRTAQVVDFDTAGLLGGIVNKNHNPGKMVLEELAPFNDFLRYLQETLAERETPCTIDLLVPAPRHSA